MDEPTAYGPGVAEAPMIEGSSDGWPPRPGVVVPIRRGRALVEPVPARPRPPAPLRVLVVEPDDDDFALTRSLLARSEDAAFAVERAPGVEAALARLLRGDYDACLCDQRPSSGRDGLDLARAAARQGCRVPIILTAEDASLLLQGEALEAGAVDVIEKEELDVQRLDRAIRFAVARERRALRLDRSAQRDELTGLASRALLGDRLGRALAAARRHRTAAGVIVLGLDGFEGVSGRLGQAAGERLLEAVGHRLRSALRETDTVARLDGDEFALVAEDLDRPDYAGLVVRKLLDAVAPPVQLGSPGETASVTASIGAALFPTDGTDPAALLRHAEAAMLRARDEGGGTYRFHDDRIDARAREASLDAAALRRAIEGDDGSLLLHFQPQVTLCAPALGLAALARWRHPRLGMIERDRIRELAEDTGLIEPLTDWLIDAACRQARRWKDAGLRRLHVAVPLLSRRQLGWSRLAERLRRSLDAAGLPPQWLELELEEDVLLEELRAGGAALPPLRELGVRLALDCFGRAATSLIALRDAPLSTVKLSRRFLRGTPQDERRTIFVGAVIALAKQLGLRLVVEGIESQAQLQMLKEQGCDAVQAFLSCPPLPPDACTDWLRQAAGRA